MSGDGAPAAEISRLPATDSLPVVIDLNGVARRNGHDTEARGARMLSRAVILGASHGTALCPLADLRPRHLWPVANEPYGAHLLRSFREWNIASAVIVCAHRMEKDQAEWLRQEAASVDIELEFMFEPKPRGTAGALRAAINSHDSGDVLVVGGGALFRVLHLVDLCVRQWQEQRADAAVLVARPSGVPAADRVEFDAQGVIRRISLHVADGGSLTGWTSSGAWILHSSAAALIPEDQHFSIREQLIPEMVRRGLRVIAAGAEDEPVTRSTLPEYLRANERALGAGPGAPAGYRRLGEQVWAAPRVQVDKTATLVGPLMLGPGCVVGPNATIHGPASIGGGCVIGRGAAVHGSVLWPGVKVGADALVRDSVVSERACIAPGARVENAILLSRALLREGAGVLNGLGADHSTLLLEGRGGAVVAARTGRRMHRLAKRTMDITIGLAILLLASPLMILGAVAIKLNSRGPVLFRQQRCTRHGRLFTMLKLRTMVADAEQRQADLRNEVDGPMFKVSRDPRITSVGVILRKTCLDEVPQMINVLRGEMSLVGPRPLAPGEMSLVPAWREFRLQVRPGVTGLWQVCGRRCHSFSDWIVYDIEYVRKECLALDVSILFHTMLMVLSSWKRMRKPD